MPGFEVPNVPKPQDVKGGDLLLRPRFKSPSSQWGSNDTADPVRRFEAPNFEPAQCYQHATSHQRYSSETSRTSTGQNAQALE